MNEKDLSEEIIRLSGVHPEKCMKCGKCTGACPSYDEMEFHPHEFVDMVSKGRITELWESPGMYRCLSCFVCVERCPRNVYPAYIIECVRTLAMRRAGGDRMTPDMVNDIDVPEQLLAAGLRKYGK